MTGTDKNRKACPRGAAYAPDLRYLGGFGSPVHLLVEAAIHLAPEGCGGCSACVERGVREAALRAGRRAPAPGAPPRLRLGEEPSWVPCQAWDHTASGLGAWRTTGVGKCVGLSWWRAEAGHVSLRDLLNDTSRGPAPGGHGPAWSTQQHLRTGVYHRIEMSPSGVDRGARPASVKG